MGLHPVRFGAALAAFLLPAPAMAQHQQCGNRASIIERLASKYQEAPVAAGVTNRGGLVEVLSGGAGGTWTIIVTYPNGLTCLIDAGEGWQQFEPMQVDPQA